MNMVAQHRFVELSEQTDVESAFDLFPLDTTITLAGFVPEPEIVPEATEDAQPFTLEDALGQDETTITPIQLVSIIAAFINNGNAPQPYIISETQLPKSEEWIPYQSVTPSIPITTPRIARQVANLMSTIGGHTALAYSGEGTHVWFTGFVQRDVSDDIVHRSCH